MAERKKTDTTAETASAEPAASPTPTAAEAFGNDDLGRIQGILFGDHAKKTGERIDKLENALVAVIDDLRSDLDAQLATLGQRIDGEADIRNKAIKSLTTRVTEEGKTRSSDDASLRSDFEKTAQALTSSLEKASNQAAEELALARTQISSDLTSNTQKLSDTKVDRKDLAKLFTATANKLAGS